MTQLLERVPMMWRGILGIVAIFGAGWTANAVAANAVGLPARVDRLERDQAATQDALAYLTCRAMEEDAGRDPRSCRTRMKRLEDYLEELAK